MPTETTYSYVAADFPGSKLNPSRLQVEIAASSIVIALERIDTVGGTIAQGVVDTPTSVDIVFKDVLSAGDKTTLDNDTTGPSGGLIAAHDNSVTLDAPTSADGAPIIHISGAQSDGTVPVTSTGREGTEFVFASHNFCDKTTWYASSTRVTGESMTDSGDGLTWNSANTHWIDMVHGKVYFEDNVRADTMWGQNSNGGYEVKVYVDAVEQTQDPMYGAAQDFSVNYATGDVTFTSTQAGNAVTVDYSYATADSSWVMRPVVGKCIIIEEAEVQFSADLSFDDTVVMSVWGWVEVFAPQYWDGYDPPGPYPAGTLIELRAERYTTHDQVVDSARGSYPNIPAVAGVGGSTQVRHGYPFRYGTITTLDSTYGMELRSLTENATELGGERATVTFYGVVKDCP